jgi:hypothetical protein
MNYNHNCKFNNFVKTSPTHILQINPIINQCHNYMDPDASIKFEDGSGSKEKRPKICKLGVGQRRRGALLSVQNEAIN